MPRLADEGEYVASESTFYRILQEENMNAYRGKSKRKTAEKPQEYVADKPIGSQKSSVLDFSFLANI